MPGTVRRLVRFGVIGVANTAVYYLAYRLLLLITPYVLAHVAAWAISVVFSFFMNAWFTFKVRPTLRRLALFPASSIANLMLTTFGSVALISGLGLDERYATLVMGILAIPVTFALTALILRPGPAEVGEPHGSRPVRSN